MRLGSFPSLKRGSGATETAWQRRNPAAVVVGLAGRPTNTATEIHIHDRFFLVAIVLMTPMSYWQVNEMNCMIVPGKLLIYAPDISIPILLPRENISIKKIEDK